MNPRKCWSIWLASLALSTSLALSSRAQEPKPAPPNGVLSAELKAEVEKLGARDANVWRTAAEALGRQRDKSVVPALIAALADPDGSVRGMAADSLGKLEDVSAA